MSETESTAVWCDADGKYQVEFTGKTSGELILQEGDRCPFYLKSDGKRLGHYRLDIRSGKPRIIANTAASDTKVTVSCDDKSDNQDGSISCHLHICVKEVELVTIPFVVESCRRKVVFPNCNISLIICGRFARSKGKLYQEAPQLLEGEFYDFYLDDKLPEGWQIQENEIVSLGYRSNEGRIAPKTFVGILELYLVDAQGTTMDSVCVEIQSRVIDYEQHYQRMLEEITEEIAGLQMTLSPVKSNVTSNASVTTTFLLQQLFFLLGLLKNRQFWSSLQMILQSPNVRWQQQLEERDIRSIHALDSFTTRQLASGQPRMATPASHPLHARLQALPVRIVSYCKSDTTDTVENRFVKYTISYFNSELSRFKVRLEAIEPRPASTLADLENLTKEFHKWLNHDFFRHIGALTQFPGNSPLLQRKDGYRDIYRKWTQYKLGTRIMWEGAEDVFQSGQRNLATLYEYWCFFKLKHVLAEVLKLDKSQLSSMNEQLVERNETELSLKLKQGKEMTFHVTYTPWANDVMPAAASIGLNIRFSYNRTFAGSRQSQTPYGQEDTRQTWLENGSWTIEMRPDYTISFWPSYLETGTADHGESQAERLGLITHVHFDAKYKINEITDQFTAVGDEETLPQFKEESTHKRIDLLKMHSYRDAIRRTGGAFILFPGSKKAPWRGYQEILPGLGAFPLRPTGDKEDGSDEIKVFLQEVLNLLCRRVSRWAHVASHKHEIYSKVSQNNLTEYSHTEADLGELLERFIYFAHDGETVKDGNFEFDASSLHSIKDRNDLCSLIKYVIIDNGIMEVLASARKDYRIKCIVKTTCMTSIMHRSINDIAMLLGSRTQPFITLKELLQLSSDHYDDYRDMEEYLLSQV